MRDLDDQIRNVLKRYQLPYNEETYALLITAYARAGAKDTSLHTLEDLLAQVQPLSDSLAGILKPSSLCFFQEKIRLTKKTIGALLAMCKETNDVEVLSLCLTVLAKCSHFLSPIRAQSGNEESFGAGQKESGEAS